MDVLAIIGGSLAIGLSVGWWVSGVIVNRKVFGWKF